MWDTHGTSVYQTQYANLCRLYNMLIPINSVKGSFSWLGNYQNHVITLQSKEWLCLGFRPIKHKNIWTKAMVASYAHTSYSHSIELIAKLIPGKVIRAQTQLSISLITLSIAWWIFYQHTYINEIFDYNYSYIIS